MPPLHTIRLRRPWLRSTDRSDQSDKVDVPDLESASGAEGAVVTYRRAFNRPTGLGPSDAVWLSIQRFSADSILVLLNGASLFQTSLIGPIRIDITSRLLPSNQLAIQLASSGDSVAALDGAVTLEIETAVP